MTPQVRKRGIENVELSRGLGRVFVGGAQVRHQPVHFHAGPPREKFRRRRHVRGRQAEARHADVHLEVHRKRGCAFAQLAHLGHHARRGQHRRQPRGRKLSQLRALEAAEHHQFATDATRTQPQCFLDIHHGQALGALGNERLRHLQRAVAVGVGLHHGQQRDAGVRAERREVVFEMAQVDGRACRTWRVGQGAKLRIAGVRAMPRSLTQATTRQAPGGRIPPNRSLHLFAPGQVLASPETPERYEIKHLVGHGGFGQVYLARRLGRSSAIPQQVCIKVSTRIDGWLREAHFGQALATEARAIRLYDRFPLVRPDGQILYCLALEYATGGDLSAFLFRNRKGWPETRVRREIAGLLQVLGKLHRGQMLHRDLTPLNVFVCEETRLKLGDFGIVRHHREQERCQHPHLQPLSGAEGDLLGRHPEVAGARRHLPDRPVVRDARERRRARTRAHQRGAALYLQRPPQGDHLPLHRAAQPPLPQRGRAGGGAQHQSAKLRTSGSLRTLKGAHVAFTGILKMKREDAMKAARRAGATVHRAPSVTTNVVVRGRPNPLQAAGREGGRKLMELKRLRARGVRISLLSEAAFRRLIGK